MERLDKQFAAWVGSSVVLALIATAACGWISVEAQGSGIPELKTMLSGVTLTQYLQPKTLFAKAIGLVCVQAAGFHTGLEGPIIHCSAIIAEYILGFKYFEIFKKSEFQKKQILTSAVSAGVVSTFGTPYGGIVFSIELCTSVYLLSNLYKGFVCATIGSFLFKYLNSFGFVYNIHKSNSGAEGTMDILHFMTIGKYLLLRTRDNMWILCKFPYIYNFEPCYNEDEIKIGICSKVYYIT